MGSPVTTPTMPVAKKIGVVECGLSFHPLTRGWISCTDDTPPAGRRATAALKTMRFVLLDSNQRPPASDSGSAWPNQCAIEHPQS